MSAMVSQITSLTIVIIHAQINVTGLCEGHSSVTGEFPAQRACNVENIPLDDVVMYRLSWCISQLLTNLFLGLLTKVIIWYLLLLLSSKAYATIAIYNNVISMLRASRYHHRPNLLSNDLHNSRWINTFHISTNTKYQMRTCFVVHIYLRWMAHQLFRM